jgi:hypothetical protein
MEVVGMASFAALGASVGFFDARLCCVCNRPKYGRGVRGGELRSGLVWSRGDLRGKEEDEEEKEVEKKEEGSRLG